MNYVAVRSDMKSEQRWGIESVGSRNKASAELNTLEMAGSSYHAESGTPLPHHRLT